MNPGSAYLLCYAGASTIISHAKINTAVAAFFFLIQWIIVVYCLAIYNLLRVGETFEYKIYYSGFTFFDIL